MFTLRRMINLFLVMVVLLLSVGMAPVRRPAQAARSQLFKRASSSLAGLPSTPLAAPQMIKDIYAGSNSGILTQFDYVQMITIGDLLYFAGNTAAAGVELWKSDGTESGTVMVKDINPGVSSSKPTSLTAFQGKLYFVANDGVHGLEVWSSDGSESGTGMVADVNPGGGSDPTRLTVSGNALFFIADDGSHAYELWKTDGSSSGTTLIKDIDPGTDPAYPYFYENSLTDVNGVLFFSHYAGSTYDWDLWKSDGSPEGTGLVKDFYGSDLALCNVNGTLFLSAMQSGAGVELWKSDGTTGGTVQVKDINPAYDDGSGPAQLTNLDGVLFFVADDGTHGIELWKSDGSEGGTSLVKDINPTGSSLANSCANLPCMGVAAGKLYFSADDGVHGAELWRSDGTEGGTALVKDIQSGSGSYIPGRITGAGNLVFFAVESANALWQSDGSEAGTTLVELYNAPPGLLTVKGDWLFYAAADGSHGKELWGLMYKAPEYNYKLQLPIVMN
jgi:ELWxxDGT repeat protein